MNAWLKIKKGGGEFKVIYGVESYFVNDLVPAVTGETDKPLHTDYICFDLETTGLSSGKERITEIGAVRVHNGEITESFDTFVDPEKPFPQRLRSSPVSRMKWSRAHRKRKKPCANSSSSAAKT